MALTQRSKAADFLNLHRTGNCFVIANPWDAGSARLLTGLGFEALATTSAGLAFALGRADGRRNVSAEEALANAQTIVNATDLPVSGDLENGWGSTPARVADVIKQAISIGLVGGSIEDSTGNFENPIYDFELAVERIQAAVEAGRRANFPFLLTARAENFLHDRPDLDDTIRRLQAFQEAGADVLFAPGLRNLDDISTVTAAVDRPVNVVIGLAGLQCSVQELAETGVTRISLGSSLARMALGAIHRAAEEARDQGTFNFAAEAMPFGHLQGLFTN